MSKAEQVLEQLAASLAGYTLQRFARARKPTRVIFLCMAEERLDDIKQAGLRVSVAPKRKAAK